MQLKVRVQGESFVVTCEIDVIKNVRVQEGHLFVTDTDGDLHCWAPGQWEKFNTWTDRL